MHTYDQNWHFPADADPVVDGRTKRARTAYDSGGNILVAPLEPEGFECQPFDFFIAEKRMEGGKGDVSAKGLRYSVSRAPPVIFNTLLYPYQGAEPPSMSARLLEMARESSKMVALEVTAGRKVDYVFFSQNGPAEARFDGGRIQVDAEILVVRTLGGKAYSVGGKDVRRAVFLGQPLCDHDARVADMCLELK